MPHTPFHPTKSGHHTNLNMGPSVGNKLNKALLAALTVWTAHGDQTPYSLGSPGSG